MQMVCKESTGLKELCAAGTLDGKDMASIHVLSAHSVSLVLDLGRESDLPKTIDRDPSI